MKEQGDTRVDGQWGDPQADLPRRNEGFSVC